MSVDEIVCREFSELATDYLEGAMPDETLELVEEHLAMCDWCRDYLGQYEASVGAVRDLEPEAPPKEMLESLLVAFRSQPSEEE